MITYKNYNVDLASLAVKKLMYNFAKEMHFDLKAQGNKLTPDRTLIKLLKSPALWFRELQQYLIQIILMNCVIDLIYYYKKDMLEKILT